MSKDENLRPGVSGLVAAPKGAEGAAAAGAPQGALPRAAPVPMPMPATATAPQKAGQWPTWVLSALAVFAVIAPVTVLALLMSMGRGAEDRGPDLAACSSAPASSAATAPMTPASSAASAPAVASSEPVADAAAPEALGDASTASNPAADAAAPAAVSGDGGPTQLATDGGKLIKPVTRPKQLPPELF
jgi:hypothetical protein